MGRRTRASMFLQCQTHPHAPLTTRCTSPTLSDAKVAKRVYEVVRHNHRTVMKCLGQAKTKRLDEHLRHLLQTCRDRPDLQDELFLVIMKQCRGGINPNVTKRAFKLLSLLFKVSHWMVRDGVGTKLAHTHKSSCFLVERHFSHQIGVCTFVGAGKLCGKVHPVQALA